MARIDIGHVDCPCCGEPAKVREQKNGRSYLLCNSPVCGFQGFTRSNDADKHLRGRMKPAEGPAQEQTAPANADQPPPKKKGIFDDLAH